MIDYGDLDFKIGLAENQMVLAEIGSPPDRPHHIRYFKRLILLTRVGSSCEFLPILIFNSGTFDFPDAVPQAHLPFHVIEATILLA